MSRASYQESQLQYNTTLTSLCLGIEALVRVTPNGDSWAEEGSLRFFENKYRVISRGSYQKSREDQGIEAVALDESLLVLFSVL